MEPGKDKNKTVVKNTGRNCFDEKIVVVKEFKIWCNILSPYEPFKTVSAKRILTFVTQPVALRNGDLQQPVLW